MVLYSLLYNLPKFFELSVACPQDGGWTNKTGNTNCSLYEMELAANEMRYEFGLPSSDTPLPYGLEFSNLFFDTVPRGQSKHYYFFDIFRVNYWYINVYVLWLNTILNIVVPIVSLVILNISTSR